MAPSANPIDLTTYSAVENWLGMTAGNSATEDQNVQDVVTALSAYILHLTGRGPADGSIPTSTPFATPVAYDEFYDGNGNDRLAVRNWPITAITAVIDTGVTIPQSTSTTSPGWFIDSDKKFIGLRGWIADRNPYRIRQPRTQRIGFTLGTQNVEIQYTAGFSAIPFDLEMCVRKQAAWQYKQKGWIGQGSQAMAAGAGTISFSNKVDEQLFWKVIDFYKARAA